MKKGAGILQAEKGLGSVWKEKVARLKVGGPLRKTSEKIKKEIKKVSQGVGVFGKLLGLETLAKNH